MLEMAGRFMIIVFLVMVVLGSVDLAWQHAEHQRKHRMSRKEMTDEQKESEGDPYLKGRRRDKGIEIATNRMMAEVPKADVVIVNPTHFAVALKWDRETGSAPVCVAKGVDEVALRIRATAMEAGVPVRHDPPTARVLYRMVDIDQEIAPEHYRAVAVAIRFADRVRGRAEPR
jgi:flagellar biosynthetic protein FlhB